MTLKTDVIQLGITGTYPETIASGIKTTDGTDLLFKDAAHDWQSIATILAAITGVSGALFTINNDGDAKTEDATLKFALTHTGGTIPGLKWSKSTGGNARFEFTHNVYSAGVGGFYGVGTNLSALNGSNVTSGTVADARLSANVALRNAAQLFTNANTFIADKATAATHYSINASATCSHGAGDIPLLAGIHVDAPSKLAGGTVTDACALVLEAVSAVGSGKNLSIWAKGAVQIDGTLTLGTVLDVALLAGHDTKAILTSNEAGDVSWMHPLADSLLSTNVGLLTGDQTFTGQKTFTPTTSAAGDAYGTNFSKGNTYAGTVTNLSVVRINAATKGGGTTITNAYGLILEAQTIGATINYALWNKGKSLLDGIVVASGAVDITNALQLGTKGKIWADSDGVKVGSGSSAYSFVAYYGGAANQLFSVTATGDGLFSDLGDFPVQARFGELQLKAQKNTASFKGVTATGRSSALVGVNPTLSYLRSLTVEAPVRTGTFTAVTEIDSLYVTGPAALASSTTTDAITARLGAPTDGTNRIALYVDGPSGGTINKSAHFAGAVTIGTSGAITSYLAVGSATVPTTGDALQVTGSARASATLRAGDDTDFVTLDKTNALRLGGTATVFDDVRVDIGNVKVGATAPTWSQISTTGLYGWKFQGERDDEIFFFVQLPHWVKAGANILPHVHWMSLGDGGAGESVEWNIAFMAANIGGDVGALTPTTDTKTTTTSGDATLAVYKHYVTSFAATTLATGISAIYICRLWRDGTNDTLDQDVMLLGIDFHCEKDALGSNSEFTK